MYNLPINADQIGLPLHEHTAFVLVAGLLHDDLDDRQDTLRGALEIDALLATWAVCTAHRRNSAQLTSLDAASRWLATSTLSSITDPSQLLKAKPLSPAARTAWRQISVAAIAAGRTARQLTGVNNGAQAGNAFWWALLCSAKHQLDAFANLNGRSPLHDFSLGWPPWLVALEKKVDETASDGSVELAIHLAISSEGDLQDEIVTQEEQDLWFRPYPEFRQLVPLLIEKLNRLNQLEEHFDETLQAEKLASLQQLAYGASHEINNPLANISTRAQTLVHSEQDSERRKKLLAINDQAFRAYEMIADLMLFAKPPMLHMSDLYLDELLSEIRNELADTSSRNGVQVDLLLGSERIKCHADAVQLGLAFKAICVNGIEAMGEGGRLTIETSVKRDTRCVEVSVEDTGVGLSESSRRHLFDPFFSGREAGRGLGFGLSKAWRIVDQHHGRIMVDSWPSRGSRFTVILPLDGVQRAPTSLGEWRARIDEPRSTTNSPFPG